MLAALVRSELCRKTLLVTRNRPKRLTKPNKSLLISYCLRSTELQQLWGTTDWVFASGKTTSLRTLATSLHSKRVRLPNCLSPPPLLLRRSGLYYRSALLLQKLGYLYAILPTGIGLKLQLSSLPGGQEYLRISQIQDEAF